jgi:hypothetical protein
MGIIFPSQDYYECVRHESQAGLVTSATWETEAGGWWSVTSLGKSTRPYLKN